MYNMIAIAALDHSQTMFQFYDWYIIEINGTFITHKNVTYSVGQTIVILQSKL